MSAEQSQQGNKPVPTRADLDAIRLRQGRREIVGISGIKDRDEATEDCAALLRYIDSLTPDDDAALGRFDPVVRRRIRTARSSDADTEATRDEIGDGIRAIQSLDDLGPELNAEMVAIEARLQARLRKDVQERLQGMD